MGSWQRVYKDVSDLVDEENYKNQKKEKSYNKNDGLYTSNVERVFNNIFQGVDTLFKGKHSKFYDDSFRNKFDIWFNNALTGDLDYERQLNYLDKEMAFNSAEAEKNRQFNLQTSNTAFQRQAEDLAKTGYNPALVLGGSGATVSGSSVPYVSGHGHVKSGQGFEKMLSLVLGSAISLAQSSMKNNTILALENLRADKILSAKEKQLDDLAYARYGRNIFGLQSLKNESPTYADIKSKADYEKLDETGKKMYNFLFGKNK